MSNRIDSIVEEVYDSRRPYPCYRAMVASGDLEWRFRLGDEGWNSAQELRSITTPTNPADLLESVVLPACREDFIRAASPFRVWHPTLEPHTSFCLLSALLGLLDAALRDEPYSVDKTTLIPDYAVAALAVELAVGENSRLKGTARPSLAQARRLYEPTKNYFVSEIALNRSRDGVSDLNVELDRKGRVTIALSPAQTRWGSFSFDLFLTLAGGPYDEPELLELFTAYAESEPLPAQLMDCSAEMRNFFGFGIESLLYICRAAAVVDKRHGAQNFIVLPPESLVASTADFADEVSGDELRKALDFLVLRPAGLGDARTSTLTLPTGPSSRLAACPFVEFGPEHLATTPALLTRSSVQLLRHLYDGRLPNGQIPPPTTPLAKALNRLRQERTGVQFEGSVRTALTELGFVVREVAAAGPITAQIDAVAADPESEQLWVLSFKDPLFPFRAKQAIEQVDRFFDSYLPQLQRNVREVGENRAYVWGQLRSAPGGFRLPEHDPEWPIMSAFVTREAPPALAVAAPRPIPPVLLRRDLQAWTPGAAPPILRIPL